MSSPLSFNQRNSKLHEGRKAKFTTNVFNLIIVVNILAGFYLILTSFRHLADRSASLDFITISLFQAILLMTFTIAGHLLRNLAGQKVIGTTVSVIPWVFVFANAVFTLL